MHLQGSRHTVSDNYVRLPPTGKGAELSWRELRACQAVLLRFVRIGCNLAYQRLLRLLRLPLRAAKTRSGYIK